jgi:hypothetical protein
MVRLLRVPGWHSAAMKIALVPVGLEPGCAGRAAIAGRNGFGVLGQPTRGMERTPKRAGGASI